VDHRTAVRSTMAEPIERQWTLGPRGRQRSTWCRMGRRTAYLSAPTHPLGPWRRRRTIGSQNAGTDRASGNRFGSFTTGDHFPTVPMPGNRKNPVNRLFYAVGFPTIPISSRVSPHHPRPISSQFPLSPLGGSGELIGTGAGGSGTPKASTAVTLGAMCHIVVEKPNGSRQEVYLASRSGSGTRTWS
jgi:hypothetical protein